MTRINHQKCSKQQRDSAAFKAASKANCEKQFAGRAKWVLKVWTGLGDDIAMTNAALFIWLGNRIGFKSLEIIISKARKANLVGAEAFDYVKTSAYSRLRTPA